MVKRIVQVWLFATLLYVPISSAFADGKAEPLAVEFKNGASFVTLKGFARGDLETEYSVAAKKGQWLMIEVVSVSTDAAAFTIAAPHGTASLPQYAWSETVKESGDYHITVFKLADYPDGNFALKVTLGARPPALEYSQSDKEGAALYAAMRRFINALRDKDRVAFLACFARSKPFYALNPMNLGSRTHYRSVVSYAQLAADVNRKRGWYWTYLERGENGKMDAFVDNLQSNKAWTRAPGNQFVAPGAEITNSTFVKWRKEGGRWVVDTISYPQT